jgi:hypothetical protein
MIGLDLMEMEKDGQIAHPLCIPNTVGNGLMILFLLL